MAADSTAPLAPPGASQIRDNITRLVRADLVGPMGGELEELDSPPSRRYLAGVLAPQREVLEPEQDDDPAGADEDEDEPDPTERGNAGRVTLLPSSFGITFTLEHRCTALKVTARWGRYERGPSDSQLTSAGNPKTVWKRIPLDEVSPAIQLAEGPTQPWRPDPNRPEIEVQGRVRDRGDVWTVTLFLMNGQESPDEQRDSAWLFQCELVAESADGTPAILRRPQPERDRSRMDAQAWTEEAELAMQYRDEREFAIGHGVSADWELAADRAHAIRVRTEAFPHFDVAQMNAVNADDEPGLASLELDMNRLAALEGPALAQALAALPDTYAAWIERQRTRLEGGLDGLSEHREAALAALRRAENALGRVRDGIALLERDPLAAEAFRLANRSMALQRERTAVAIARRKIKQVDEAQVIAETKSRWYPFQLAFILLNLAAVTDLHHPARSDARDATGDLLWFPTGGGKTEAYLGLAAYTMVLRRLQGVVEGRAGEHGVAVLMRYTLRLLTVQQFQRAAALVCALEMLRRDAAEAGDRRLGETPFRIGLWVGMNSTPNSTSKSEEAVTRARQQSGEYHGSHALQLTRCPWCGSELSLKSNVIVESYPGGSARTIISCSDPIGSCPFTLARAPREGLPVITVDEEIYRRLPALLIATVDKFARMPWAGATQMLFGHVDAHCPRHGFVTPEIDDAGRHAAAGGRPAVQRQAHGPLRPPDLIIQDELHLISGPLGSLVGLYETALDEMCSWTVAGKRVRPKLVASTATIRRASQQMQDLFMRRLEVFPPGGLDTADNFFARRREPTDATPGRRYLGLCAPGRRVRATYIQAYVTAMLAAQTQYDHWDKAADPWMTLVGYFNTLRDLGGMRRMVEDDVRTRLDRGDTRGFVKRPPPNVRELTSRMPSSQIPRELDLLERTFSKAATEERKKAAEAGQFILAPVDVLLATSMVSVGVDVPRLGLMVVAGQPKTVSEYIQATSRVGRQAPGLVLVALNWARPRDLSHYERFRHFHATIYRHVEALSVTPFAPRALDRGLSGVLVTLIRLAASSLNANSAAQNFKPDDPLVAHAKKVILDRVGVVTGDQQRVDEVERMLASRVDTWHRLTRRAPQGSQLGYEVRADSHTIGLLRTPETGDWQEFTCLSSLREVEPTVNLVFDDYGMDNQPDEVRP